MGNNLCKYLITAPDKDHCFLSRLIYLVSVFGILYRFCVNYHQWAVLKAGSLFKSELEGVKTVSLAFGSCINQS